MGRFHADCDGLGERSWNTTCCLRETCEFLTNADDFKSLEAAMLESQRMLAAFVQKSEMRSTAFEPEARS